MPYVELYRGSLLHAIVNKLICVKVNHLSLVVTSLMCSIFGSWNYTANFCHNNYYHSTFENKADVYLLNSFYSANNKGIRITDVQDKICKSEGQRNLMLERRRSEGQRKYKELNVEKEVDVERCKSEGQRALCFWHVSYSPILCWDWCWIDVNYIINNHQK